MTDYLIGDKKKAIVMAAVIWIESWMISEFIYEYFVLFINIDAQFVYNGWLNVIRNLNQPGIK